MRFSIMLFVLVAVAPAGALSEEQLNKSVVVVKAQSDSLQRAAITAAYDGAADVVGYRGEVTVYHDFGNFLLNEVGRELQWWQEWWVGYAALALTLAVVVMMVRHVKGLKVELGKLKLQLGEAKSESVAHKAEADKLFLELYVARKKMFGVYGDNESGNWSTRPEIVDRAVALKKQLQ